ncbi:MAG TPA: hypothetical protein VFO93_21850 [Hymenobacter sp.]|uniref:hypothetical protein n=1 Tax=Hymenobacter sp. TaxID=1898978 RepID=UPI002D80CFE9|nr:hypothetical protein [Hymenobacter sp.]HET9506199.1 hypothetical protein [Hymenobacter sp.]
MALTFWHNYNLPLDGDLAAIVLPAPWYAPVLHDPFGWAVLAKHETYAATNRFFAHAEMGLYWKVMPRLLQKVIDPISSLYLASALFTTLTQAGLLFLLAKYIELAVAAPRRHIWLIMALLVPFFQTATGGYEQMGITDRAATYTFFYAVAMLLVLVLLWPFYQAAQQQRPLRLPLWRSALLVALMVVVSFNGPVATATIAVWLLGIGVHWAWGQWQRWQASRQVSFLASSWLSGQALLLLGILAGLSLYSLYVGRYNVENSHTHTLPQLYKLLAEGSVKYLTYQAALPALLLLLLFNFGLIRLVAEPSPARQRVLATLGWIALFIVAYVALLPFGGYRSYRPYLLRNDSVLPAVLGIVFAYGLSAYFLLAQLRGIGQRSYLLLVCLVGGAFLVADASQPDESTNGCQRWSLDQLARAPEPVVELAPYCDVLSWGPIRNAPDSEFQAQLLEYWHITPTKKLYYQK